MSPKPLDVGFCCRLGYATFELGEPIFKQERRGPSALHDKRRELSHRFTKHRLLGMLKDLHEDIGVVGELMVREEVICGFFDLFGRPRDPKAFPSHTEFRRRPAYGFSGIGEHFSGGFRSPKTRF